VNQSLAITIQPSDAAVSSERWVRLEQEIVEVAQWANLYDIGQMLARAQSGLSAWSYVKDDCPITVNEDGTIDVALDFWSYPSSFDFDYSVGCSIGTLGERIRVEREREIDVVFDRTSRVDLPYYVTMPSVEWISPVIDRYGRSMARPHITAEAAALSVPSEIGFGACRVRAMTHGYLHTAVIRVVKQTTDQDADGDINTTGYRITSLQCDATANWPLADGSGYEQERLSLAIPKCVESYLESCSNGNSKTGTAISSPSEQQPHVYYNSCTGSVMLVLYK
jgi:hypothetical protein